ncbi:MAG: ATP synthase F1 subunit gamma [Bacilli bacterium]|nr:ATP synthase F1 subunit gamma [Bacilli bacterium]
MAQGLNKVKRRIATVNSTRKVTNAMKLIASVKFRQAQNGFLTRKKYNDELQNIVDSVFSVASSTSKSCYIHEFEDQEKILYVVISSSLGLCGSYNYNIIRYLSSVYRAGDEIIPIGSKIHKFVSDDPMVTHYDDYVELLENITMGNARVLARDLIRKYRAGNYKKVVLIYTNYINQIAMKVESLDLLPLPYNFVEHDANFSPDLEPNMEEMILKITRKYLANLLFIKLNEAYLSENSARRNAMDNADKNAEELSEKLTIEYNKARQAAITQEITEVVAGSVNK